LLILIFHLIFSFALSETVSQILHKRFVKSNKKVDLQDKQRLESIESSSWIKRYLFEISLHKNNRIATTMFIFLFNLAMPLIGYLFTIWITWYLLHVKYEKKVVDTNALNLDEFGISFLKVERTFGEGSMNNLVMSKYTSKSKKIKAISLLAANISPANLKIVRQTLASPDDEIRMFGYAIINKAEKALNQKINAHLEMIDIETANDLNQDKELIANSQKGLAFLYWEMIYTELSHDSLKTNFLNSVIFYLKLAKKYYLPKLDTLSLEIEELQKTYIHNQDGTNKITQKKNELQSSQQICADLYMLRGKVYMKQNNYKEARTEFTNAQKLVRGEDTFIIPYLAEVYYELGKYNIVKSLLKTAKGLELNTTLLPIIEQWRVSE